METWSRDTNCRESETTCMHTVVVTYIFSLLFVWARSARGSSWRGFAELSGVDCTYYVLFFICHQELSYYRKLTMHFINAIFFYSSQFTSMLIQITPGGIPGNSWWVCAARFSKSWPYFRPKNVIFHTRFQTRPLIKILQTFYSFWRWINKKI